MNNVPVRRDNTVLYALGLAVLLGLYVRLWPVLITDFPLNDGGLFYLMAQEVRAAHFSLPVYTAYNHAHIPFTYPPLAFYLAAILATVTGADLLNILRILPPLLSTLAIPAFYLLSQAVLRSRLQAILATFAFTLLPRTYSWMIMGGGLTRAPGFVFAILTLHQAYLLYTKGDRRFIFTTACLASLTALTHAEMTWFIVYSLFILWLFYGHNLKTLAASLLVAAGTILLTAPWWITAVGRHGLAPFQAAAHTGSSRWFTWHPTYITGEAFWPLLGFSGLLGLAVCCFRKQFYLPAWTVLIFIVQPRSARTLALIPLSMAIGLALEQVILPALNRLTRHPLPASPVPTGSTTQVEASQDGPMQNNKDNSPAETAYVIGKPQALFLGALLIYSLLGAWYIDAAAPQLQSLAPSDRTAMQWVLHHTPPDSRFVVLTSDPFWDDKASEWFPALTRRVSVATVQGSEWLPHNRFYELWQQADALGACAKPGGVAGISCVEHWAQSADAAYSDVYIRKEPKASFKKDAWKTVEQALRASRHYTLIYDGPGASIFARHLGAKAPETLPHTF